MEKRSKRFIAEVTLYFVMAILPVLYLSQSALQGCATGDYAVRVSEAKGEASIKLDFILDRITLPLEIKSEVRLVETNGETFACPIVMISFAGITTKGTMSDESACIDAFGTVPTVKLKPKTEDSD